MDQNVNVYRIGIRGKKWWWPIFTWLVDVAIENAWQLSRLAGNKSSQLKFRTQLALAYINEFKCPLKSAGRKSKLLKEIIERCDGLHHYVQPTYAVQRRRCAGTPCKSISRTEYQKCKVGLCVKYFVRFHTKN